MRKVFNFDGPVFSFMSRLADLTWLNLIYIICCIPIITIGAATTALYYVTLKMAKDEESYITKSFFKSFKDNFKQATLIWLIFFVIIMISLTDLFVINGGSVAAIFNSSSVSNVVLVAIGMMGIIVIFTLVYVFPLLAQFDNTIVNTIKNAFFISIRHLPYTVAMIVIGIIPWVIMYNFVAMYILVLVVFALVAYINSRFFNKIFVRYMPKEEIEEVEENKEES